MSGRVKDYEKHIACLESLWDENIENETLTFAPILNMISQLYEVNYIRLACNTEGEFRYNLDLISKQKEYDILYFAFHGDAGTLYLHDGTALTLDTIASAMGRKFKGWIVHFGSCGTMNLGEKELAAFAQKTGAAMLVGYTETVDWAESAALDLLFLTYVQSYVDMHAFWAEFEERYRSLIEAIGFTVYVA